MAGFTEIILALCYLRKSKMRKVFWLKFLTYEKYLTQLRVFILLNPMKSTMHLWDNYSTINLIRITKLLNLLQIIIKPHKISKNKKDSL